MTALLHWCWQGALVALVVAVVLRGARRIDGATRHLIWWGALATVLVLPLAWPQAVATPPAVAEVAPIAGAALVLPALPRELSVALLSLWIAWAGRGLLGIGAGLWRLHRLRAQAKPISSSYLRDVPADVSPDGSRPRAEILVSDAIRGACLIGFRRPAILLSRDLVEGVSSDSLARIVLHEQAHLDRRDDWGRLAQTIVGAVFGVHPAVRFILGRLDEEREVACDEWVVARTGDARRYAATLAEAAAIAARGPRRATPALVPAALRSRRGLRARVLRLLEPRADLAPGTRRAIVGAVLAGAVLAIGAARLMSPAVVFVDGLLRGPVVAAASLESWRGEGPSVPAPSPRTAARRSAGLLAEPPVTVVTPHAAGIVSDTAAVVGESRTPPEPATVSLSSRVWQAESMAPALLVDVAPVPVRAAPGAWAPVADAGMAVGRAADRTGVAIGDAAARSGSAVGRGARRAGTAVAGFFARAF